MFTASITILKVSQASCREDFGCSWKSVGYKWSCYAILYHWFLHISIRPCADEVRSVIVHKGKPPALALPTSWLERFPQGAQGTEDETRKSAYRLYIEIKYQAIYVPLRWWWYKSYLFRFIMGNIYLQVNDHQLPCFWCSWPIHRLQELSRLQNHGLRVWRWMWESKDLPVLGNLC